MVSSGLNVAVITTMWLLVTWYLRRGRIEAALFSSASSPCMAVLQRKWRGCQNLIVSERIASIQETLDGSSGQRGNPCPRLSHQSLLRLEKKGKHHGSLEDRSPRAGSGKEG